MLLRVESEVKRLGNQMINRFAFNSFSDEPWAKPFRNYRQEIYQNYSGNIGKELEELVTPSLILDRKALYRNINKMTAALEGSPVVLRPHTKVQKSTDLARVQIQAGAVGVTVSTIWEAAAMFSSGVGSVLIANVVAGRKKIDCLGLLAKHGDLIVAVDSSENIEEIACSLKKHDSQLSVLIDLDVGLGRCGARSPLEVMRLAHQIETHPNIFLKGIQAYEGHCMLEPNPHTRAELANKAMDYAGSVLEEVTRKYPGAVVLSGGGTGTYNITGKHPSVTELQAGSYVFMDTFHSKLVSDFEISLTVLSTVVARHEKRIIMDAGRKSIGIDFSAPKIKNFDLSASFCAEEHALFDIQGDEGIIPGDRLEIISGYAPTTVNLHDVIYLVEENKVAELWPVFPRGPQDKGFMISLQKS
jgi:D-serine deaminase-like pyridoxal phosphate-dependent protein